MPIATSNSSAEPDVDRILKLQVPLIVKLAERRLPLADVLHLGVGSVLEFAKPSGEPLTLLVNNKPIATGEAVKVGENFGLRLTHVGDPKQIIQSLRGR